MKKEKEKIILVGAHISISDGFEKSPEKAASIGANVMQIFTKSSRSWLAPKISKQTEEKFKNAIEKYKIKSIIAHSSYLINLAASKKEVENKSIKSLVAELKRCHQLGIKLLIIHPGNHTGQGTEKAITQIAQNIDQVFDEAGKQTKILLETTAGQGTSIGSTFEQLTTIYDLSENKKAL